MLVLSCGAALSSLPAPWCWGARCTPCSGLTCVAAELLCSCKERHRSIPVHPIPVHPIPILIVLPQTRFSPRGRQQQPQATRSEQTGRLRSHKCTRAAVAAAHQPLRKTRETTQHRNQTTVTTIASVHGQGPRYDGADEVWLPSCRKHFWLL